MNTSYLSIISIGLFRPENEIDNQFLENLDIETSQEWIMERVGIKSRRTVLDLDYIKQTKNKNILLANEASRYTNAQTAKKATLMALERANLKASDIGLVIAGSCSPQTICPTESATIAHALEIEVPCIDLHSSCSSAGAQIHFLNSFKPETLPDYVLLVQPENNTRAVDYSDRSSAVLWGDCTTAMIVSTKHPGALKINKTLFYSSPKDCDKVTFKLSGHFSQLGRTVQTFAIKKSIALIHELKMSVSSNQISHLKFIGHQANLLMLQSICQHAEILPKQHLFNVDLFGNTGASSTISVLSEHYQNLEKNTPILITQVGAGLSWAGILLEKTTEAMGSHF